MQPFFDRIFIAAGAMFVLIASACSRASSPPPAGQATSSRTVAGIDSALRAELILLGDADQAERDGFGAAMAKGDTAYLQRLMSSDSMRTRRLQEIVRARGWPTPSRAGKDGAEAAWLILQHSDDLAWQESLLPVLEQHAGSGELTPASVALLTDRILVRSTRPQRYGSSFTAIDGRLVAHPIEDIAGLDARRAAVGLPPMSEYVKKLAEVYGLPVTWPPGRQ